MLGICKETLIICRTKYPKGCCFNNMFDDVLTKNIKNIKFFLKYILSAHVLRIMFERGVLKIAGNILDF